MTQLAGKFAGVVLVTVPDAQGDGFLAALIPLEKQGLFDVSVGAGEPTGEAAQPRVMVELVGNDHPGIVHELSSLLADHDVSIDDLQTWTSLAPMSGGGLFEATALLRLPPGLSADRLLSELEALAADLMVDLSVVPGIDETDPTVV